MALSLALAQREKENEKENALAGDGVRPGAGATHCAAQLSHAAKHKTKIPHHVMKISARQQRACAAPRFAQQRIKREKAA